MNNTARIVRVRPANSDFIEFSSLRNHCEQDRVDAIDALRIALIGYYNRSVTAHIAISRLWNPDRGSS